MKYGFDKDIELVDKFLEGGTILTNEVGVWCMWESTEEAVRAALPECFDYVGPYVTCYVARIGLSNIGPAFMESGLGIPCSFRGNPGGYAPAFLMYGPGAEHATVMGRETYGIPKKYATNIEAQRTGDRVHAFVERDGVRVFELEGKLGEFENPAAAEMLGCPKKGDSGEGAALFFQFDTDMVDGKVLFRDLRLNETVSTMWDEEDAEPGNCEITLRESYNDPWSALPVVRPVGMIWATKALHMTHVNTYRDLGDEKAILAKLMPGRYDMSMFGYPTIFSRVK